MSPLKVVVEDNDNTTPRPPVRRKLGRRARKKRRRILGIEAEAKAAIAAGSKTKPIVEDNHNHNNHKYEPTTTGTTTITTTTTTYNNDKAFIMKEAKVPTDRSYQQSSCQQLCRLTEHDQQALIRQLGYLPGNALEVVTRVDDVFSTTTTHHQFRSLESTQQTGEDDDDDDDDDSILTTTCCRNEPLVIKLYPLVVRDETDGSKSRLRKRKRSTSIHNDTDQVQLTSSILPNDDKGLLLLEPFPTIFWVTHPRIKALVSKLELDGMGRECEQLLKQKQQHQQQNNNDNNTIPKTTEQQRRHQQKLSPLDSMKKAHLAYGEQRRDLLVPTDWEYIRQRKWDNAFSTERGVAGIRNPAGVKCLHAHVAHFWSGCHDNIIGKMVAERLEQML
ncbi:DUF501 domain containing protein [Nitzschia inconspicua]|uniref:DUF501 domain containing protein n=1 Tax=Nitzschia inconspicua TaxID=303405 RepID=A0A9K3PP58_9STRA|nr:DUF501 domain containing protein [Nitzschia inconspicua]